MGNYTEIFINTDLKEDTPANVIQILEVMCGLSYNLLPLQHKPARWLKMFSNNSYYTSNIACSRLSYDEAAGYYSLLCKGDIENFNSEIEEFFEFISPWCDDDFIGYYRYEDSREPILVYTD